MSDAKDPDLRVELSKEDPVALAEKADLPYLARLGAAEDLLEKQHHRKKRSGRLAILAQALVGYVALAGFFANAYQNWNNKKQAEERARADEERWAKEFKRSQDADKYRAFFETSALATDTGNPDKRLVGYALLKEFVDDKEYNAKATFMLEESLALELRGDVGPGLDEPHRAAVTAILTALSHTSECKALARASRTVRKIAQRRKSGGSDDGEAGEVLQLYILGLVGRAAEVCPAAKDFREVRAPIVDVLLRMPALAGLAPKADVTAVRTRVAEILRDRCTDELESGITDCADVPRGYAKLCVELVRDPGEVAGCAAVAKLAAVVTSTAPAPTPAAPTETDH